MFNQYFGHYLLNRELITREQLTDALELQQAIHVKFGVIAVDEGYMTPLQVEEVHEKQKQEDRRFGEMAIELGYLTNEQVDSLISNQKKNHLSLAQALVDRGYMTIEQFGTALHDYKKEHSLSDDQFEDIKNGNIESLIENILNTKDILDKSTYRNYLTLFIKNMIRFIDDQAYLDISIEGESDQQGNWLVCQEIYGESPLFTAISANEDIFLKMASVYAEEELTEIDDLAQASVSEFLNLHNGIYLVNMSNWGIELNMRSQEVFKHATVSGETLIATVYALNGSFQFILSDQPVNIERV